MKNLLNPKWLLIINILPLILLLILLNGQFNIIKTLLEPESIKAWNLLNITLGASALLNLLYAAFLIIKKKNIDFIYGFISLLFYIVFLYIYVWNIELIIPWDIPVWLVSDENFLYVGSFLMPTIAYSLFILIAHFTPKEKKQKAWVNFLISIAIPLIGFLFVQIGLPLWRLGDSDLAIHSIIIVVISATIVFFFFLVRGFFIIATRKSRDWRKYQLVWKIPITIILPLLGLVLNNGGMNENSWLYGLEGIFGDFSNTWFYILAIVNGILLCLPDLNIRLYRSLLFVGRTICFAFTFYFFMVFLPFLPISVVLIVAFGSGILMLTPLFLFIIHVKQLKKDFIYLKENFSYSLLWVISIISFLLIPILITSIYIKDKVVLNETLEYIYTPDLSKDYDINTKSLKNTITTIKEHKNFNFAGVFGSGAPYLSTYFNWLVMDNLTLSEKKINDIESVFFDEKLEEQDSYSYGHNDVQISNVSNSSIFDSTQNAWISWVDFEITNNSENSTAEFNSVFEIPDGCWISDYYLYIGEKKEYGILAEKQTAMWVFNQIRNVRRDPGLLHYLPNNKISFRVYPFTAQEERKTGIEFIHKEPLQLDFDGNVVSLGDSINTPETVVETEDVIFVSSKGKENLKKIKRKPYFHFIVDASHIQDYYCDEYINRIDDFLAKNQELQDDAKISFVDSYVKTMSLDQDWKQAYSEQSFEGGFFLDRAIQQILIESYKENTDTYPVIVVVTNFIKRAFVSNNYANMDFMFPDNNKFYVLDAENNYTTHSLINNTKKRIADSSGISHDNTVLEFICEDNKTMFLTDNNQASIVPKTNEIIITNNEIAEKQWQTAMQMKAYYYYQILNPHKQDEQWYGLVDQSFKAHIMCEATSFIALENEAQKAMLKKKQEQVLNANKSLDIDDQTNSMSEPTWYVLALLFLVFIVYNERRKRLKI